MGMLDEVLKVQDRGDLLWIENVSCLPLDLKGMGWCERGWC